MSPASCPCTLQDMNRILLLLMAVGLPAWAMGQAVLEQPGVPAAGFSKDLNAAAYLAPSPASDAPQAWDFSDVSGMAVGLQQVLPAGTSSLAPEFEGAEWVNSNGDQLSFWRWADGGMSILGNANAVNAITIPFDDPSVQWTYPLSYGDFHEDTFACEDTLFSLPYTLDGAVTSEVDAFGSLILPTGVSISEVLRVQYDQATPRPTMGTRPHGRLPRPCMLRRVVAAVFFHEQLVVTDPAGLVLLEATDVAWFNNTVVSIAEQEEQSFVAACGAVEAGGVVHWQMAPFSRGTFSMREAVCSPRDKPMPTVWWACRRRAGVDWSADEGRARRARFQSCSAVVGPLMLTKRPSMPSGH